MMGLAKLLDDLDAETDPNQREILSMQIAANLSEGNKTADPDSLVVFCDQVLDSLSQDRANLLDLCDQVLTNINQDVL
jgi:hypothetical protein